ncbi:DUF2069 domain-containing protein [Simiduia agarivorans]|uniref:Translation elongation factor Tu n=1 Tax=Simiduia agarivorans (strain DSM 21679 / JCM 13881 / BCRC 17597 / SA1) TaxID=1117647 RepID=K4KGT9_SIMAS|nr:DUF2069 domain-containing protein [Simiduia agarivorans]AFU98319.1 translation elongation factor Tu [Simiduia agarivorans SA1 = DSM 21679]
MTEHNLYHFPDAARKARLGQRIALISTAALILNAAVEQLTEPSVRWTLLLLQSIPLLMFVPGMLANHHRTYSWLCFVVLFYFIVGVTNVMSPLADTFGWVLLAASTLLFMAAMMTSRWLQQASVHNLPKPD